MSNCYVVKFVVYKIKLHYNDGILTCIQISQMNVNKTFSGRASQVDWLAEGLMRPLMDFINIITSLDAANNMPGLSHRTSKPQYLRWNLWALVELHWPQLKNNDRTITIDQSKHRDS